MKKLFVICVLGGILATASGAGAEELWGTTFGAHSEIFLVDTSDGSISTYMDFGGLWFGDIAVNPTNTYLYVTHFGIGFDQLSQIDVATLNIQQTWTLPAGMNALAWKTGTSDKLYGIQGGGALDGDLYEITISGTTMTATLVGTIPSLASDGDIAQDPATGHWYATFLPANKTYLWDVDVIDPANSTQGPELGDYGDNTGRVYISALAFTEDGTLWGGSWGTNSGGTYSPLDLYTIDPLNGPAGLPPIYDLSGTLQGDGITGLASILHPDSVYWKGLTWSIRGASTTATVSVDDYLDISVLGNETGQGPDNWNVSAMLPSNINQANGGWVEFTWVGNEVVWPGHGPGCRAYIDTLENGFESMFQCGSIFNIEDFLANHHVYDSNTGTWPVAKWYGLGKRRDGVGVEHTFKVGMKTSGEVDIWFDGGLLDTFEASENLTFFEKAILGIDTANGTIGTGTYTDFRFGTCYGVTEPVLTVFRGGENLYHLVWDVEGPFDLEFDTSLTFESPDVIDVTGLTEYDYYTEEGHGFFRLKCE